MRLFACADSLDVKMLKLAFDETKATQTAAYLLRLSNGSLKHLALIKMLYKIDRLGLAELGLPVTTDEHVSMPHGPVTSRIFDLIKSSGSPASAPSFWSDHIVKVSPADVKLINDPGTSELSRAEEKLIARVHEEDGHRDRFDLRDESHEIYPEWKDPHGSSRPIALEEILNALGVDEDGHLHTEEAIELQRLAMASRKE